MKVLSKLKWKVSIYNRKRKLSYIQEEIPENSTLLDVGVAPIKNVPTNYANYLDEYFLKKDRRFDALGLERSGDFTFFKNRYTNCNLILFDGRHFPDFLTLKPYDIALSNAVIEHVGTREEQLQWLKGLRSVCKRLIITTPNKYFPVESHTNILLRHIFSKQCREWLLSKRKINLFSLKEFIEILENAGFQVEKIKKNKLLFMTLDFVIVCK